MAHRPKRDRKPPERFEPPTPTSTVAVIGAPAHTKKGRKRGRWSSSKIEQVSHSTPITVTSSRVCSGTRGHSSGNMHGRMQHRQHQQLSVTRLSISNDDPAKASTESSNHVKLLSGPLKSGGKNRQTGSDIDSDSNAENEGPTRPPHKRRAKPVQYIPYFRIEDESTIEQWYTDPYERLNPASPAYDEWRRQNLENALLRQGWHINRTKSTVNWLMQQTTPKPLHNPRKQNRRRTKPRGRNHDEKQDQVTTNSFALGNNDEPEETRGRSEPDTPERTTISNHSQLAAPELRGGDLNRDGNHSEVSSEEDSAFSFPREDPEKGGSGGRSSLHWEMTSIEDTDTPQGDQVALFDPVSEDVETLHGDTDVDVRIKALKGALKKFEIVYGDDLPDPDYAKYTIDYCSQQTTLPRSVRKAGFLTQGHGPLYEVAIAPNSQALLNHLIEPSSFSATNGAPNKSLFHNQSEAHSRLVLTEDPHLGFTPLSKSECYTQSEQRIVQSQDQRKEQETEEEIAERRAQEAEENEDQRASIQAQLRRKVFEWENENLLRDEWTKQGDRGVPFQHLFQVGEDDSRWKEIRERQAILAAGGQRAVELLLKDEQKAKAEADLIRRREVRNRARDRKRANMTGIVENDVCVGNGLLADWNIDDA